MKLFVISLLLLLLNSGICAAANDFPKIGVLRFDNRTKTYDLGTIQQNEHETVSEYVIADLVDSGKADIVEQSVLEPILQEHYLGTTGLIRGSDIAKLGKLLPADYLLCGSIINLTVRKSQTGIESGLIKTLVDFNGVSHSVAAKISIRVIRVKDGRELMIAFGEGQSTSVGVAAGYSSHTIAVGSDNVSLESVNNALEKAAHEAAKKIIDAI